MRAGEPRCRCLFCAAGFTRVERVPKERSDAQRQNARRARSAISAPSSMMITLFAAYIQVFDILRDATLRDIARRFPSAAYFTRKQFCLARLMRYRRFRTTPFDYRSTPACTQETRFAANRSSSRYARSARVGVRACDMPTMFFAPIRCGRALTILPRPGRQKEKNVAASIAHPQPRDVVIR